MGDIVEFPSNGATGQGYLATPGEGGTGPGVIVIQEYWGLVPHIKSVADRFAGAGFVALAPDLFHGQTASEPDEAGKLMMSLKLDEAANDMSGAVDYLDERSSGEGVGVVGFCMGGGLALYLGTTRPDKVKAVITFYGGIPWEHVKPDYAAMEAAVQGHFAAKDGWVTPEVAGAMEQQLRDLGKDVDFHIYPEVDHAFFNDDRPEVYNAEAAAAAWARSVTFFEAHLGF